MNAARALAFPIALLLLLPAACGKKPAAGEGQTGPAARPAVAVEVEVAAPASLQEGIDITGALSPRYAADVKTELPGRVTEVYVTEWVAVAKGTPLARTDTTDIMMRVNQAAAALDAARATLAEAETAAARAERERARMAKLRESGLATSQEAENVDTEAAAAASRVESARARVKVSEEDLAVAKRNIDKATVVSPMNGVVSARMVNVGDIPGDKAIFRIVDNRTLDLTATVPTSEMSKVRPGQTVTFETEALPGQTFTALVKRINPSVNAADRTVGLQAEVRNAGGELKDGLFVKGRILTSAPRQLIAVPRSALSAWDTTTKAATLLVVQGGIAKARPVTTGALLGDTVEILSGLAAGESFVVRGGFLVKDGDAVTPAGTPAAPGKEG